MEEETITICVLHATSHGREELSDGEVIELPKKELFKRILARDLEPAGCAPEYIPSIPPQGCTLDEALSLHLQGYPGLQSLLDRQKRVYRQGPIWVSLHDRLPVWGDIAHDIANNPQYWDRKRVFQSGGESRLDYQMAHPERLYQPLDKALLEFIANAAKYSFIRLFREGKLISGGVAEDDLKTLERSHIPKKWYQRNIVLTGNNEIFENTNTGASTSVRRWSDVTFYASPDNHPVERRRAGRPNKLKEPLLSHFKERASDKKVASSLQAEAITLHNWALGIYSREYVPSIRTIERLIKTVYEDYWANLKK